MPKYSYTIRTSDGNEQKGALEAVSYTEATVKAQSLGGMVVSLEVSGEKAVRRKVGRVKVSLKDRIVFTEQLAVMLRAGITLVQALKGLAEESSSKGLALVISEVVKDVEAGTSYSSALAKYPSVFSNVYCQMVRSAEKTGNIADILNKLTIQQQKEYDLRGKVKGALIYPAIISVLLVGVVIMVITFILPKLATIFADSHVQLPLSTRFLLALSSFLISYWYILIALVVGTIFGLRSLLKIEKAALAWDRVKLRLPVLGNFLKKSYMARFCQTFASLAQAGVPVLEIFQIVGGVVGSKVYEVEITKISADVENGVKISTAIRKSKYFPAMVGQLVSVGEQSGDLAEIFNVLGEFFDKEVDSMAKNLSTLLEPIIMIVMGGVIGFILVSVLQPIYGLVNTV